MKLPITHFFYVAIFCLSAQMLIAMDREQREVPRKGSVTLAQAYPDGFRVTDPKAFTQRIETETLRERPWPEKHPIKCATCAACTTVVLIAAQIATLASIMFHGRI